MEARNVILITIDSLRADHCSFMGYKRKTTPTLDKIARKGLTFKNTVAASLPTPLSMYAVFTSSYYLDLSSPLDIGLKKSFSRSRTLADILSKNKYTTIGFNKNPYIPSAKGFGKGFRLYNEYVESKIHRFLYKIFKINRDLADLILGTGIASSWRKEYSKVLEILKKISRPYFLWIIILDTHIPYIPVKRKWSKFHDNIHINYLMRKYKWKGYINDHKRKKLINAYDDCILNADESIKRILKDTNDDDPIIIVHADHGDGFGEHGLYHHPPMLYEELIRVPLVIYNADIREQNSKPVSLINLAPTILELLGLKNEFPNQSFMNSDQDYVISIIVDKGRLKVAVRNDEWKYIIGQKEKDELYNIKNDPLEQVNLIDECSDITKDLRRIAEIYIKTELEKHLIRNKIRLSLINKI